MGRCGWINENDVQCGMRASFQIFDDGASDSEPPIEACDQHVGALLGGPVTGPMPTCWHIYPIEPA